MSYVNVFIHAVWGVKARKKILLPDISFKIIQHIFSNAKEKGYKIYELNTHLDHVHCLMALNADCSLAKQMQLIKGESAHWMNRSNLLNEKFEWANEYFATSVSVRHFEHVRMYIRHQQEHHRKVSFEEEYAGFIKSLESDQG